MKPLPFQIPKRAETTVLYQEDRQTRLYGNFHKHPETQITYFLRKGGTAFIDGVMESYQQGDIYLINGDIPHVFRSDDNITEDAHAISLFFDIHQLKETLKLPELKTVQTLIWESRSGIRITGGSRERLGKVMVEMREEGDFGRLIKLLVLLKMISRTGEYESLPVNHPNTGRISETEGTRMRDILEYSFEHYQDPITLDQISRVANMTTPAFCRYFKKRTRKSYISFLNEIRVHAAQRKLLSSELTVSEICYDVGFSNLSNFNRFFKRISGVTPSGYRTQAAGL